MDRLTYPIIGFIIRITSWGNTEMKNNPIFDLLLSVGISLLVLSILLVIEGTAFLGVLLVPPGLYFTISAIRAKLGY